MEYLSTESCNTDMKKSSSYVNAYIFPSHIEGVGVSYCRHFKTIPELEAEIANLEVKLKNSSISQNEYDDSLRELQEKISARRQIHAPKKSKSKIRIDNMQSLKRSQKRLLLYLYGNFDSNTSFIRMTTLTYQVKVFNMKITVEDFGKFREKFKRMFPNAVWIAIYEFHADGSTHVHFIFRNAPGATHEVLTKMWGHGMVYVSKFDPERIPYFCKDRRLENYPAGCKLYAKSRNCKLPKRIKLSVEQFEDLTKNMECVHSSAKMLFIKEDVKPNRLLNHFIYKKFIRKENKNYE